MVKNYRNRTFSPFAINCLGFGMMCFLIGCGYSMAQAKVYQMELAEFKLAVGSALSGVKQVSDTLERSAVSATIAPQEREKIRRLTEKSSAVLEQVESDIEDETEKLIYLEPEY